MGKAESFAEIFFIFSALMTETGPPSREVTKTSCHEAAWAPFVGAVSKPPRLPNPPGRMKQKYAVSLEG